MQGIELIANVVPITESGQRMTRAGPVVITSSTLVDGSTQSNGRDRGCHTAMALQAMLRAALSSTSWHKQLLPTSVDAHRDAAWRQYVGGACLARRLDMRDPLTEI